MLELQQIRRKSKLWTPIPASRVILSGGRQPEVEPGGRPQVGISKRRAHQPLHCTPATVKPRVSNKPDPCFKVF